MIEGPFTSAADQTAVIFRLIGKIYAQEGEEFSAQLETALDAGVRHLWIDCGRLQQIDSSSLGAIIKAIRLLKSKYLGDVVLFGANDYILSIFRRTRIDLYCRLAGSEAEAALPNAN